MIDLVTPILGSWKSSHKWNLSHMALLQKHLLDFSEILHEAVTSDRLGIRIFRFLKRINLQSQGDQKGSKMAKMAKIDTVCQISLDESIRCL